MANNVTNGQHVSRFIKTQLQQAVKQYFVYDGSGRMTHVYAAPVDAVEGETCMLTQYGYDGASIRIIKTKESLSNWQSAWDL